MADQPDEWMTLEEAAAALGVSERTVLRYKKDYALAGEKRIAAVERTQAVLMYRRRDVFLAKAKREGTALSEG